VRALEQQPERLHALGLHVIGAQADHLRLSVRRALPEQLRNTQVKNGFYDAGLNAVFLHSAGDSRDDGVVQAYRYKTKR
jgi:hypothetical protein